MTPWPLGELRSKSGDIMKAKEFVIGRIALLLAALKDHSTLRQASDDDTAMLSCFMAAALNCLRSVT